jgi:uncharacterized cupin superfamily protein
MPILKLPNPAAEPDSYFLPAEKLLSGNPRQTVRMHYTDPTRQFFVGEWESEVGKWKISYTEEEYCQMLEGVSVITDEQGCAVTVRQRRGGEQAVDGRQRPPGFGDQASPAIRHDSVYRKDAPRDAGRQVNRQPIEQVTLALTLGDTLDALAQCAQPSARTGVRRARDTPYAAADCYRPLPAAHRL